MAKKKPMPTGPIRVDAFPFPVPVDRRRPQREFFRPLLAVLAFGAFVALVVIRARAELEPGAAQIMDMAIGAWLGILKDIYGWAFGSSRSSESKTDIMGAALRHRGGEE